MKLFIKITLIVCFLQVFICEGQTSLYFDKYYKTGYDNLLTSNILLLEDTTYTFLNYVRDSTTGRQNMSLLKTDEFGNELLKKTHDFGFDYLAYLNGLRQFTSASKSSILVTAITYTNSQSTISINKISKQTFDTIKNLNYYDGLFSYYAPNIIKIHNNKFFLIGNKFDAINYWPFIFELDSNLVIKNNITCVNTQSLSTKIAFYDPINKKLVLGGGIGINMISFISIVDTLGNFVNTFINNSCSNVSSKIIYSAYDNTYITIGAKKTSVYGSQVMLRPYVCKYNANNLNLIWQKTYGKSNMVNTLYDGVVNADGSIVLVGRYSDSLNNPLTNINCNAVMLKIRSNGDSLWMKQFDNLNNTSGPSNNWWESFFGIEKTSEGGYIMCGNAQQMPLAKAWVVKTDSLGCDTATCLFSSGFNEISNNNFALNVYPNPNSGSFNIEVTENDRVETEISLVNVLGIEIKRYRINSGSIKAENIPPGIYTLQLFSNKKRVLTRKVIVAE